MVAISGCVVLLVTKSLINSRMITLVDNDCNEQ